MKLTENSRVVLQKRYLAKDSEGKPTETVEQLFERVANAIAESDRLYDKQADVKTVAKKFYDMMTNLEFLPNSPTLMNAGRPLGQLSACFVLPIADSMEDIFETIKMAALIHKSGGGTGFSFSRLRPKGSTVNSTGGVASGPISFMKVFNMATEAVKQGGTRRGANMGILRVDHPDILEFIDCKHNATEITNFNISVGMTEKFMRAVEAGEDYELVDPATNLVTGTLNARDVFNKIVDSAWRNGEPGIIFLDRLNRDNPVPHMGEIESTNPCGEQPLLPYESCNLGSINLVNMTKKNRDGSYAVDYKKLERVTRDAVHFLDNVIDANRYPLEKIDETTKATRKIGLGVMGFADLLLMLGIPYNSEQGIELAGKIMGFIEEKGHEMSRELAETRGTFPVFRGSVYEKKGKMRNATVTTIAPTGTLSIIAGCSSGVEPVFAYVFIRNVMDGTELIEVNPILKEVLIARGLYSDELMKKIASEGCLSHVEEIPDDIKRIFVSAHEVSPEYHIRMQAAFQEHTDNAVSKTVNFGNSATREDVSDVYHLAYELGCKGVTIYRDGSRSEQVLNIGKVKKEGEPDESACEACQYKRQSLELSNMLKPRLRPDVTTGFTEKMTIGCGNLYVTVNYDDNGLCEVFTNTGRHGGCPSQSEATSRLVSLALRSGISPESVIEQLKGIRCPSTIRQSGMKAMSCPDAIARVITKVLKFQNGEPAAPKTPAEAAISKAIPEEAKRDFKDLGKHAKYCPECGTKMEHEGGCVICHNCGYSKCG
ncbi:vitamin B12-dependent ribonucleotide reductase [Feifania hominis]|uniref:Vitamin B12-dependent ribonucleotide reductase n=1 Tax=Feifania hominis TaxID=2763660 RepID=A0A926DBX5_9FIRM|nr:vitamin B12-dependent ribonucleotide reductase [Feifania hominis]MBC8535396.1 vitamin B12-dependent ribonucleotide reductase [Feifania hominis]